MKPTRIVLTRGASVNQETGEAWTRVEYTVEMELEDPAELQIAKAELTGLIRGWLEAETLMGRRPMGKEGEAERTAGVLVAEALRKAKEMEGKAGKWMWSRDAPELKAALLDQGGKMRLNVDGVDYDVKLGDSKEEEDAFISFWPRTKR